MLTTIREKLHALATAAKKRWLVLAGLLAAVAPAIPDILDKVQAVDFSTMTLRGAAVSVGLIVLRTLAVRFLLTAV
jgi:hypothetical protein